MEHDEKCEQKRLLDEVRKRHGLTVEEQDYLIGDPKIGLCWCLNRKFIPDTVLTHYSFIHGVNIVADHLSTYRANHGFKTFNPGLLRSALSEEIKEQAKRLNCQPQDAKVIRVDFRNRRRLADHPNMRRDDPTDPKA